MKRNRTSKGNKAADRYRVWSVGYVVKGERKFQARCKCSVEIIALEYHPDTSSGKFDFSVFVFCRRPKEKTENKNGHVKIFAKSGGGKNWKV